MNRSSKLLFGMTLLVLEVKCGEYLLLSRSVAGHICPLYQKTMVCLLEFGVFAFILVTLCGRVIWMIRKEIGV